MTRRPSSKRILDRLKAMKTPGKNQHEFQKPKNPITADEFWKNVRTNWPREERIKQMRGIMKLPWAKDKDPQAYEWVMEENSVDRIQKTE